MNTIEVFRTKNCTLQLLFLDTFLEITTQVKRWSSQYYIGWEMTSTQLTPQATEANNYFTFGHFLPSPSRHLHICVIFNILLLHSKPRCLITIHLILFIGNFQYPTGTTGVHGVDVQELVEEEPRQEFEPVADPVLTIQTVQGNRYLHHTDKPAPATLDLVDVQVNELKEKIID